MTYPHAKCRFLTLFLAFAVFFSLSAFRHTDVEGHTDPDFRGYTFRTVVVHLPNATLDFEQIVVERLGKELRKRGIRMVLHENLFAPTREWDEATSAAVYREQGIDAGLVITIGNSGSGSTPGMMMFNASTSASGFTTGTISQGTMLNDYASFSIALIDTESRRTAWVGELDTRAGGLLFVGSKKTAKSLVNGLLRELEEAGHLRTP